jgi:hypothetical protein
VLQRELQKLGSLDNVASSAEGVVFRYKGNVYKFTGSFASVNQILGLFRYGRQGTVTKEADLSRAIGELIERSRLQLQGLMLERLGTDSAAKEQQAREQYHAAVKELEAWQRELDKKHAFYDECKRLGIRTDSVAARRLRSAYPDLYDYDPKVVQKSGDILRGMVARARARYGLHNPLMLDAEEEIDKEKPGVDRESKEGKDPPPGKHAYVDVADLQANEPYSWDDPRWADAIKSVPLGFGAKEGSHPGEERLAVILGAQQQGDTVSFDLKTTDGQRWEVKGLRSAKDQVRPGGLGMQAYKHAEKQLFVVIRRMRNFVREVKAIGVSKLLSDDEQRNLFRVIDHFVSTEFNNLTRGEISEERFWVLRRALKAANLLKRRWEEDPGAQDVKATGNVNLAGKDVELSRNHYIDVVHRVNHHSPHSNIINTIDDRERVLYFLDNIAFDDPDDWLDRWDESINLEHIFADVSGIFIVTPQGFIMIPRQLLDQHFKLKRVSKGVPHYGYEA